jgi:nucleoside-diphosphate kinase
MVSYILNICTETTKKKDANIAVVKIINKGRIVMEKTLVILKPDAVKRKLLGEILSRFEKKNLEISNIKMEVISKEKADIHYAHVKHLPLYDEMIEYMTTAPSLIMVVKGEKVIQVVRGIIGRTNSFEAQQGTIRGDYGLHLYENLVHASDSQENALIEIDRFFGE